MDRLGLGAEALKTTNPDLIYISASGMGRTGPEAKAVAYGTLLQCYSGFAGLNRHPDVAPRVGFAWCDPMCGLMLGFIAAAALWHRQRDGGVARIDFSMIEAMLWTMAEPLMAAQLGSTPKPMGNASPRHVVHGVGAVPATMTGLALLCGQTRNGRRCAVSFPAPPMRPCPPGQHPDRPPWLRKCW
jgi:crotonobetainyl-CoA:carnitine CoA-transferase CaiB-like acyl-CoA transferase